MRERLPSDLDDLLELAVSAAQKAGRSAWSARGMPWGGEGAGGEAADGGPQVRGAAPGAGPRARSLAVRTKANPRDLVTELDERTEALLRETLAPSGIPVFGEEGGPDRRAGDWIAAPRLWIVDPIDGTANFVHGLPHFAVAVALLERGRPLLGVLYDPNAGETVWAVRGGGCHLAVEARAESPGGDRAEGGAGRAGGGGSRRPVPAATSRRVHVDDRPLAEALVGASLPSTEAERARNAQAILEVVRACRNIRVLGSAATQLAYVALGRLSAAWDVRLSPWDMAAGWLMVEEAGGVVTDVRGEPFSLLQRTIVAANPRVHGELLALLRGLVRE